MTKNLNMVDVMKFVMAFCVIGIHSYIFGPQDMPSFFNYIVMTAVSFFITASGYLCFQNKGTVSEVSWLALAYKFLRLYVIWVVLYLPLIAFDHIQTGGSLSDILASFLRKFFITGSNPWAYHLWYLLAVAVACALIGLLSKMRLQLTAIWAIGIVLMIAGYWAVKDNGVIGQVVQPILETANNGFTYGLGAFATGMMLTKLNRHKVVTALVMLAIGYVLFNNSLPLSGLLGGASIFLICESINLKDAAIYRHLRALSSWIYFLHMYVMFIIMYAILHGWVPHDRWMGWLLASTITLICSVFAYLLSTKYKDLNKLVK